MAYNRINHCKRVARIIEIYGRLKETDKPDSEIVRNQFPKAGVYISYRTWMNIKGMKQSELPVLRQATLF